MNAAIRLSLQVLLFLLLISGIHCVLGSPDWGDLPGVYEVASDGRQNVSVTDIHRYSDGTGQYVLTLGLVIENRLSTEISIDASSFYILDNRGNTIRVLKEYPLKNPLEHRDVRAGSVVVGSIAFKLDDGIMPAILINEETGIRIRLDKEVKPPGNANPPGAPVMIGNSIVGIEGISGSKDGKMLRVDYLLKNSGPGVFLLENRDYGRFGVLVDTFGWSYPACDYKMLGPAIPPGGAIEGYMIYAVPQSADPRYLLFWPPDEDAILFDLGQRS